jgi:hypothetical protein
MECESAGLIDRIVLIHDARVSHSDSWCEAKNWPMHEGLALECRRLAAGRRVKFNFGFSSREKKSLKTNTHWSRQGILVQLSLSICYWGWITVGAYTWRWYCHRDLQRWHANGDKGLNRHKQVRKLGRRQNCLPHMGFGGVTREAVEGKARTKDYRE